MIIVFVAVFFAPLFPNAIFLLQFSTHFIKRVRARGRAGAPARGRAGALARARALDDRDRTPERLRASASGSSRERPPAYV